MADQFDEDRRRYAIDDLVAKLDVHFNNEKRARIEYSESLLILQNDLKSLSESTKRMAEVLERLAIAEERDKTHGISIGKLQDKVETLSKSCEVYKETTNKWLYGFTGMLAALSFIGTVFGGYVSSRITDYDSTINAAKIHMEIDKPAAWPPENRK